MSTNDEITQLLNTNPTEFTKLNMGGDFLVKVLSVYDGDTITIGFLNWCGLGKIKFNARCIGYNTPEIKIPTEKTKAILARDYLRNLILGKIIRVNIADSTDKYGRLLIKPYLLDGQSICDLMLANTPCHPYQGGTRETFDD